MTNQNISIQWRVTKLSEKFLGTLLLRFRNNHRPLKIDRATVYKLKEKKRKETLTQKTHLFKPNIFVFHSMAHRSATILHRCASLSLSRLRLWCRTTFALLRSALRRGRFIPEIYPVLKRLSRKRFRVLRFKSFLRCSLNLPPPLPTSESHFSETHRSYYFTRTLVLEPRTLKLYEPVGASRIYSRTVFMSRATKRFSFRSLTLVTLELQFFSPNPFL